MSLKSTPPNRSSQRQRVFSCRPKEIGCRGKCCGSSHSRPQIFGADLLILANKLSHPVASVWREYGDFAFFPGPGGPSVLSVELSLRHDPCPFLDVERPGCLQYEARPINCAAFPFLVLHDLAGEPEEVATLRQQFPCLGENVLSPSQNRYGEKAGDAWVMAKRLDIPYIFDGQPIIFIEGDRRRYEDILRRATQVAPRHHDRFRADRFTAALDAYNLGEQIGLTGDARAARHIDVLAAAHFLLHGDRIAFNLERVEQSHLSAYAECLRQFEVLRRAMP